MLSPSEANSLVINRELIDSKSIVYLTFSDSRLFHCIYGRLLQHVWRELWSIETKQGVCWIIKEWLNEGHNLEKVREEKESKTSKRDQDVYFPTCCLFGLKTPLYFAAPYTTHLCVPLCVHNQCSVYTTKTPIQDSISWQIAKAPKVYAQFTYTQLHRISSINEELATIVTQKEQF